MTPRPGYEYVAETARSLLRWLSGVGAVTADEVEIDMPEDRLRAEVVGQRGVQILPIVIGAWTRSAW